MESAWQTGSLLELMAQSEQARQIKPDDREARENLARVQTWRRPAPALGLQAAAAVAALRASGGLNRTRAVPIASRPSPAAIMIGKSSGSAQVWRRRRKGRPPPPASRGSEEIAQTRISRNNDAQNFKRSLV